MRKKKELINDTVILTLNNGDSIDLEDYRFNAIPRKDDILQWNGIRYHINEVVFHQKEGFKPYIELISDTDN